MRTGPQNNELQHLVTELKTVASEQNIALWKRVANDLSRPTRSRRVVNLHTISRNTKKDDIIVVPGKVLSDGEIAHGVSVAAFKFSKLAVDKIVNAGGKVMTISELVKTNKEGKNVKIIG